MSELGQHLWGNLEIRMGRSMRERLTNTGWENCLWEEVQQIRDFGKEWESGCLKGLEKAKE